MPYSPPIAFTGGTPVLADDLNTNNDTLRKYINKGVVDIDLASDVFGTTEIVKGE